MTITKRVSSGLFLFALSFFLSSQTALYAFDIDRTELASSAASTLFFYNYEGPHARIDSREAIRQIGVALGQAIAAGSSQTGSAARYSAIRVLSQPPASGFDADVIMLGIDVGVDHIRNLRTILQGYLQAAFSYTEADAQLLANLATIYNAVYRGSWEYFVNRYNPLVISFLDQAKVGLSIRYDDWPGRTQILLPLISLKMTGLVPSLNPSPLTDPSVVEELKTMPDHGVEIRQAMVELKENQADSIRQSVQIEREAIVEEEAKLTVEKAALDERRAARDQTPATPPVEKTSATAPPVKNAVAERAAAPAASETEVLNKEEPATEEPKKIEEEAPLEVAVAAIAAKEEELAERKELADAAEAEADRLEEEAAADREAIAEEQQDIIASEESAVTEEAIETILSVKMTDPLSPMASLVRISTKDGTVSVVSPLPTIRSRSWVELEDGIIAVAGIASGLGAIRLVKIDKQSLEMLKQGEDDIHPDSPIWIWEDRFYALVTSDGSTRLMTFNSELERENISSSSVHPYTAPIFMDGKILVQGADGNPLLLDALTLGELR